MGATLWRVLRQLLLESLVLALIGGAIGLGVAVAGVRAFAAVMQGSGLPSWVVFSIDHVVIGYVLATCMLTAILSGLAPALHVMTTINNVGLKEDGRGAVGSSRERWFSGLLIVAEVALTVMLLAGSAVMIRSFVTLYSIDIGVDIDRLMTMGLELPASKYPDAEARRAFFAQLEPRLLALPGVEAAAVTTGVPGRDGGERLIEVDGQLHAVAPVFVSTVIITPRFFDAVSVRMVHGRNFAASDGAPGAAAVIVNERLAARFFPGEDPLGKRIRFTQHDASPESPRMSGARSSASAAGSCTAHRSISTRTRSSIFRSARSRPLRPRCWSAARCHRRRSWTLFAVRCRRSTATNRC